ncbi:MAG: dihydrofolate reductase family protein [Candidatus Thiodiazotropha sp. DIVDIV]
MNERILRLYPPPNDEVRLKGLYLSHNLHTLGSKDTPYVYANFVSSLDGRIAVGKDEANSYIPERMASQSDLRLLLELQAQADCLITHGGYMRELSAGRLGNVLQVGTQLDCEDLAAWRLAQGLTPQPAVIIVSASLDFPLHPSLEEHQQAVYIATGKEADPLRVRDWQAKGCHVLFAGEHNQVQAESLMPSLKELGFKSVYLSAGPQILDTFVRDRLLACLFCTVTHQLIGGTDFHTMLPGPLLGKEGDLRLHSLYYEPGVPGGAGQFFTQFEPIYL